MHLAVEWLAAETSEEDTLIIVTADHSHPLSLVGYPDVHTVGDGALDEH